MIATWLARFLRLVALFSAVTALLPALRGPLSVVRDIIEVTTISAPAEPRVCRVPGHPGRRRPAPEADRLVVPRRATDRPEPALRHPRDDREPRRLAERRRAHVGVRDPARRPARVRCPRRATRRLASAAHAGRDGDLRRRRRTRRGQLVSRQDDDVRGPVANGDRLHRRGHRIDGPRLLHRGGERGVVPPPGPRRGRGPRDPRCGGAAGRRVGAVPPRSQEPVPDT